MRHNTRNLIAAMFAAGLIAAALPQPASAYNTTQQKCRAAVAKSGGKFAKTVMKALTGCHGTRDKDGPNGLTCNDLPAADLKLKVESAATKLGEGILKKCTSGTPAAVAYID